MRIELPPEAVRKLGPMEYSRTWACGCGAKLTIRARENRGDGASNFDPKNTKQQPSDLTWEGLREERGWARDGDTITCPACQRGITVAEYKMMRRREGAVAQIAELKRQLQEA